MVNAALLQDHAKKFKMGRDTCAEFYRQLFTRHPELAKHFDAEDLDPDSIPRSQKFMMAGAQEMQFYFRLAQTFGNESQWKSALSSFHNNYQDVGFPDKEFNKTYDAFLAAMEKHAGGVTAEQKKNWEELLAKAYADMKSYGWY